MPELTQEELDVRAREAVHSLKAQRSIFGDHWAAYLPTRESYISPSGFEKIPFKCVECGAGKLTISAARRHFSVATSCVVPWISGTA